MPFKIRLKKSRQYNVVSKSLFVISVELLDSNAIECTLSSGSNGRECLDNVCQRLGLQQPEFFGLRFVNHERALRWVELDRPLKKQLDKHAKENSLYLRVMYYIQGISLITDEMTRYHYFLQLKNDVIEGRINCTHKQASMLASYSMQAEFGNHVIERHTPEYLKDFALFPKHLVQEGHLESLTRTGIVLHAALTGVPQGTAEEYYILEAQRLDGYGQETFLAKDENGSEVIIGVSLSGIFIGFEGNSISKFYRWKDITNVVNHKKYFGMECQEPSDSSQYQLPDVETAKYIWRMCVHQHTFFMHNEGAATESGQSTLLARSLFQLHNEDHTVTNSNEELEEFNERIGRQRAQSTSCIDLTRNTHDLDRLRALLPTYRPAPDYETAIQNKYRSAAILYSSQPEIHQANLGEGMRSAYKHFPDVTRVNRVFIEQANDDTGTGLRAYGAADLDRSDGVMLQLYKPPPPYRPNSNSTPDLASQQLNHSHTFINPQHLEEVGGSSIFYVMGQRRPLLHPQNHNQMGGRTAHPFSVRQGLSEPIYENVPLPWVSDNDEPRSRAASIQSAPEIRAQDPPPPPSSVITQSQPPPLAPSPSPKERANHHEASFTEMDSSTRSSDGSVGGGTLGKTGKHKGLKWSNLLGGTKHKQSSSTLPKLDDSPRIPLSPSISKEAMCQLLEKKLADSQLFFEFEKIPKQKPTRDFTTALHQENLHRNRFNDVLPYEDNRVRLAPTKDNKYGYINASHITATVGTQQRFYIAAQSPLLNTISTFWQMVWEADIYLVVSLPAPGEDVPPYLPTTETLLQVGQFEVVCQFSQTVGHCATSKLLIQNLDSRSSRGVWHLQYTEWGHQGCPNAIAHFLGFLEEMSSVRQHTITEIPAGHNRNPPVLVHCSTGVGPTAITILCDLLLFTLDHNQELDIPRTVYLLRHQRMLMIQNISQYRFIYSLLIYYLKNSRLI